ncbi:hypothetical protein [Lonepinella sp. MS14437]|uniref:hypothetical protein n=1 Tax=Lonepinella sp. MS14437 TaxID=3003620 RepID=UPI0036DDED74
MKMFINQGIIFMIISGVISSCTPKMERDLWNGVYSERALVKEYEQEEKAYYDKENSEQKELRKKNIVICREIARKKYPNETIFEGENSFNRGYLYRECMKKKGSPLYSVQ